MAVSKKGSFGDGTEFGDEQKKEEKTMKKEVYSRQLFEGPSIIYDSSYRGHPASSYPIIYCYGRENGPPVKAYSRESGGMRHR